MVLSFPPKLVFPDERLTGTARCDEEGQQIIFLAHLLTRKINLIQRTKALNLFARVNSCFHQQFFWQKYLKFCPSTLPARLAFTTLGMDKLQLTGRALGRVFNFGSGCMHTMHLLPSVAIQPNLELKTRPKQLIGFLPLVIALPALGEITQIEPEQNHRHLKKDRLFMAQTACLVSLVKLLVAAAKMPLENVVLVAGTQQT